MTGDPTPDPAAFNAHLLRLLSALAHDSTVPLDLNIALDIAKDDDTAHAIIRAIAALVDRVRRAERLADPIVLHHSLNDTPIAGIPCPTCGRPSPSALTTPPTILERALEPPPDLPTFDNELDELVYLRDAVRPLREQAQELQLLKDQVQDIARVCNAVARGDLSQKITVPVQGIVMVQLKDVINTMVDKLGQFAKEVTRVSQEVGTEGFVFSFYTIFVPMFS